MVMLGYILAAFFVGAIPFSYIITKLVTGKDIRKMGSGNPGATNVVRVLDIKHGMAVLLLDVMKGFIPVYLIKETHGPLFVSAVALALVLGHDFSPFLRFKGGKGVATSLGVFLVIAPVPTLLIALVFFSVTSVFKFVSFGSVIASISYPVIAYLLGYRQYIWLAVMLGVIIVLKHRTNLKRLWMGNEKRAI